MLITSNVFNEYLVAHFQDMLKVCLDFINLDAFGTINPCEQQELVPRAKLAIPIYYPPNSLNGITLK